MAHVGGYPSLFRSMTCLELRQLKESESKFSYVGRRRAVATVTVPRPRTSHVYIPSNTPRDDSRRADSAERGRRRPVRIGVPVCTPVR